MDLYKTLGNLVMSHKILPHTITLHQLFCHRVVWNITVRFWISKLGLDTGFTKKRTGPWQNLCAILGLHDLYWSWTCPSRLGKKEQWHCLWKKSCTTWENPLNYGRFSISTGGGFLNHQPGRCPSPSTIHQPKKRSDMVARKRRRKRSSCVVDFVQSFQFTLSRRWWIFSVHMTKKLENWATQQLWFGIWHLESRQK